MSVNTLIFNYIKISKVPKEKTSPELVSLEIIMPAYRKM
jgi:hypothetical protein